ncbi:MAG: F0F1 ATP synthase subunit gamma [Verrucomicrobia bacterium]|nr:F0F1 ATP synthase subunit gamma [Verrucomicrobiota bacterium]
MPSTRDIRRRIKSVKSTAQITKAMQLVAAAKMKKAQDQAANGRPYAELLNKVLVSLKDNAEEGVHPYFSAGKGDKTLVLLIASDKGLCGALNTNLLKKLVTTQLEGEVDYVTIGKKAVQGVTRLEQFRSGEYKKVLVVFNNFINTVTVVPTVEQLLPVNPVTLGGKRNFGNLAEAPAAGPASEYTFEPDAATVFESVLPQYVNDTVFQMVLESRASEHSSRMVAMKNATDNAKQMVKDLSLEYNKLRQAAITNELLEITTAKMALE